MNADPDPLPAATATCVAALYRFTALPDYKDWREPVRAALAERHILGTVLLAAEGINGTIAGDERAIDEFLAWLVPTLGLGAGQAALNVKKSWHAAAPFLRLKVRLKREIVTMGVPDLEPAREAGTYVQPRDWNALISDPEVLTIDTRNDYEVSVGRFQNAVNPATATFREFPDYARRELDPARHPKVAMYCTGGIRCEKATAYLKRLGFAEVYHLQGGILRYLEEVPADESLWQGECFVFDDRVTVNHALEAGTYTQCHACRAALSPADLEDPHYQPGVQCGFCFATTSAERKSRHAERERQIRLARDRGGAHLGAAAEADREARTAAKRRRRRARQQPPEDR
ncbi:MAG: rhodanese-related sulfurtransferase [Gammaproteobacteria bacterium]|jgi:UPF0176 protein|nr:rhodanese-related sulfurtransferase [Gammaproteobacteria bacterium]